MMCRLSCDEMERIRMCNTRIRNENHLLRCTLKNLTDNPYSECAKVLSSVIAHCSSKKCKANITGKADCLEGLKGMETCPEITGRTISPPCSPPCTPPTCATPRCASPCPAPCPEPCPAPCPAPCPEPCPASYVRPTSRLVLRGPLPCPPQTRCPPPCPPSPCCPPPCPSRSPPCLQFSPLYVPSPPRKCTDPCPTCCRYFCTCNKDFTSPCTSRFSSLCPPGCCCSICLCTKPVFPTRSSPLCPTICPPKSCQTTSCTCCTCCNSGSATSCPARCPSRHTLKCVLRCRSSKCPRKSAARQSSCSPCRAPKCPRPCSPPCMPFSCKPSCKPKCSICDPAGRPCCRPARKTKSPPPCIRINSFPCPTLSPPYMRMPPKKSYDCLCYEGPSTSHNICKHNRVEDAGIREESTSNNNNESECPKDLFSCDHNQDRFSSSCGTGICGGYTPSGWNKLLTKHSVDCCDPCCPFCCPPNRCPSPCPGAAEPCPCFRGKLSGPCSCPTCPRRKPKPQCKPVDSCNSRASPSSGADENCSGNCRPSAKILGEMAFQLERRILDYVFGLECTKRRRFYGYTVSNIVYMMEKEATTPKGNIDLQNKTETVARLKKILIALNKFGYDIKIHGDFAREMVNKYGLLACPPDSRTIDEFGLYDPSCIAKLIEQLALGPHEKKNLHILLKCLKYLSKCDGRPLFVW